MLSGYLSPDGTFHNAPSYSHMSVAQQIAEHNSYYNPCELPEDTIIADELVPKIKENYIEKSLVKERIAGISEEI